MTDTAAHVALYARRNEVARFTIAVAGIDLTGVDMKMQVRLQRGNPQLLFALATVGSAAAEGLKLDSVSVANGVPTSIIKGRINASTMTDGSKVPYTGEVGSDAILAYAMTWTLSGDTQVRLAGDFVVVDSAYNSDAAPATRPASYGGSARAGEGSSSTFQFGDQVIRVTIDGAEITGGYAARAESAAGRAEAAAGRLGTSGIALATGSALVGGNVNEVSVTLPDDLVVVDETLIRLNLNQSTTGPLWLTTNKTGRSRVLDQDGNQIGADRQLEGPSRVVLTWGAGGNVWTYVTESRLGLMLERLRRQLPTPPKDALDPVKADLIERPHGTVTNAGGTISRTTIVMPVLGVGSSVGTGAGAPNQASHAPNRMLVDALEALRVSGGVQFVDDNQSRGGEVVSQFEAQRLRSTAPSAARILSIVSGMNDAMPASYFAGQTFSFATTGGEQSLRKLLAESRARGEMQVLWTSPHPHPDRFTWSLPAGKPMIYPTYKDAPISPADLQAAIGPHLVDRDWTGRGKVSRGVRTFWHWNEMLRQLARECDTCILADAEYSFFRWGVEVSGYDWLYGAGEYVHPNDLGYEVSYGRTAAAVARAITANMLATRYFRGDEFTVNTSQFEYVFADGTGRGAAISRAAGPWQRRGETGAIVTGNAADTMRFDYDPPVENQIPFSRQPQGAFDSGGARTVTQDGEVTKIVQTAVPAGGFAFEYFDVNSRGLPVEQRSYAVELRGDKGGEVVWLLIQRDDGGVAYKRVSLTTDWQRIAIGDPNTRYAGFGVRRTGDTGPDEPSSAQTYYARRRQLNRGTAILAYVETTGAAISIPAVCRGLMLEPQDGARPPETLRLTVDNSVTGDVDLYYADGSFETRTGALAGGVLSLPASATSRVIAKARARRAA